MNNDIITNVTWKIVVSTSDENLDKLCFATRTASSECWRVWFSLLTGFVTHFGLAQNSLVYLHLNSIWNWHLSHASSSTSVEYLFSFCTNRKKNPNVTNETSSTKQRSSVFVPCRVSPSDVRASASPSSAPATCRVLQIRIEEGAGISLHYKSFGFVSEFFEITLKILQIRYAIPTVARLLRFLLSGWVSGFDCFFVFFFFFYNQRFCVLPEK